MGSPNGGIVGVINPTSFGKCTVTSATGSTTLTTQPGTRLVSAAVVAGGGGAGGECSGGGGAGGLRTCASISVCGATPYSITVGGGGAGTPGGSSARGTQGSSTIFSTITSAGGGAGGSDGAFAGGTGGSGGGGGGCGSGTNLPGGAGNTPPVSPPQGNTTLYSSSK